MSRLTKKDGPLKCAASEALALLPVLCFFVSAVGMKLEGVCLITCAALLAVGDLVDLLQAVPHGLVEVAQLKACIDKLIELCLAAGFQDDLIPKFHWLLHFPHHLAKWRMLPTCFTHERKHKWAKRYAEAISNTRAYSKSVITEIVSHQLFTVSKPEVFDLTAKLLEPKKAKPDLTNLVISIFTLPPDTSVLFSHFAGTNLNQCSSGDLVMIRSLDASGYAIGRVWVFVSAVEWGDFAFVSFYRLKSFVEAECSALWTMSEAPSLCSLEDILSPTIWSECSTGVVRALIPYEHRGLRPCDEEM